jgi:hypothetical protein
VRELLERLEETSRSSSKDPSHQDTEFWSEKLGIPAGPADAYKGMPMVWYALSRRTVPRDLRPRFDRARSFLLKKKYMTHISVEKSGEALVRKIEKIVKDALRDGADHPDWKRLRL